jgi:hypothetical protein
LGSTGYQTALAVQRSARVHASTILIMVSSARAGTAMDFFSMYV